MPARLARLALLASILLTTSAVTAHGPHRPVRPVPRTHVSMQLEDEAGRRLETFHQRGQTWVLGRHGQRYNVRVRNHSAIRVEVVVGVDGRDVVSGQVTDLVRHRGHVIPAHGSVRIQGFRRSMSSVAAFRFTDPGRSYSSRMGTPHRVGVISLAAFPERVAMLDRPIVVPEDRRWHRGQAPSAAKRPAQPSPRAGAAPDSAESGQVFRHRERALRRAPLPRNNLGTEYGEMQSSRVMETNFERQSRHRPAQWLTIRYDDQAGLRSRGIEVHPPPPPPRPVPLPISQVPGRFATPPPPPHQHWWH